MRVKVEAQVVSERAHRAEATTGDRIDAGRAGAREHGLAIVATEQDGSEVEHIAIHEPGSVKVVGDGGATLDEHLEMAEGPQLVEDRTEVARPLEARVHLGLGRSESEDDPHGVAARRRLPRPRAGAP